MAGASHAATALLNPGSVAHCSATNRAMVDRSIPRASRSGWFKNTWSLLWRKIQDWPPRGVPHRSFNVASTASMRLPGFQYPVGMPTAAA